MEAKQSVDSRRIEDLERRNRDLAAVRDVAQAGSEGDVEKLRSELLRIALNATDSDCGAWDLRDASDAASAPDPVATGGASREILGGGVREAIVVPLRCKTQVAGALHLGRRRPQGYTAADMESAQIVADQIAIQLERVRLQAESERRVAHITLLFDLARLVADATAVSPLVERVLDRVPRTLAVDVALVHLVDSDKLVLAGYRSAAPNDAERARGIRTLAIDEESIAGRAASWRRTVTVDAADWPRASSVTARSGGARYGMAAPLISNDRVIGTFCLIRVEPRPFSFDEVQLLESCAAQLARAVEHAYLFEAERRRGEDLALINELGHLISEQLDVSAVLATGVRNLSRIADVPDAFLMLLDRDQRVLRMVASNVDGDDVMQIEIARDDVSAATTAIRERRPVVVDDTTLDRNDFSRALSIRFGHRAVISVPLISRGTPVGAVVLGETREGRGFAPSVVERAVAVSNQLATAIANARLFEDLRQSYQQLERAQEKLVQRERLAALGELAASVAHEVRNPLGVLFNSLASIRKLVPAGPEARMLLDIADEEAERLNHIVGELLDFARPFEVRLAHHALESIIGGAAEAAVAQVSERVRRLDVDVDARLASVRVDAQMMRQALINLIVNALQATADDVPVKIRAREELRNGRTYARIDVIDAGAGIPGRVSAQIFQPFFTTKAKGTGLGLAIVKRIAEAHHGDVSFESTEGTGTTFTVRVPIDTPAL